jgi:hypothetical protein
MLGGIDCGTGEQGRPERVVGTEPDDRRSSAAGGGSEGRADGCCLREAWVFGEREGAREAAAAVLSTALRAQNKCTSCTFTSQTLKNLIEYYKKILIIMILNKYY